MPLDTTDRRILTELQADAGLSIADVAQRVGLSMSPCWRRIKRLRQDGVILGQVTLVDAKSVGLNVTVYASVTLTRHSEENVSDFDAFVRREPSVTECHTVTGDRDYMLRILVPDIESYERFMSTKLLRLPYIGSVNSRFALRQVKYSTALPLDISLAGDDRTAE